MRCPQGLSYLQAKELGICPFTTGWLQASRSQVTAKPAMCVPHGYVTASRQLFLPGHGKCSCTWRATHVSGGLAGRHLRFLRPARWDKRLYFQSLILVRMQVPKNECERTVAQRAVP